MYRRNSQNRNCPPPRPSSSAPVFGLLIKTEDDDEEKSHSAKCQRTAGKQCALRASILQLRRKRMSGNTHHCTFSAVRNPCNDPPPQRPGRAMPHRAHLDIATGGRKSWRDDPP